MIEKKKYKYISFELVEEKPKTSVWECENNKSKVCLGHVKWYFPWRGYCFYPEYQVLFNRDCMLDIADFLDLVNKGKKGKGK